MYIFITVVLISLAAAAYLVYRRERQNRILLQSVTSVDRGTSSERRLVVRLLRGGMPAVTIFHDLYVDKRWNRYSQIDLAIVTRVGIFVIEVKHYSGWIFGRGTDRQWTQVLNYGKEKYRFYNPVKQNEGHIAALSQQLSRYGYIPFYSVIVFCGDCQLRNVSFIPEGVFITGPYRVMDVINAVVAGSPPAHYTDKLGLIETLRQYVRNGDDERIRIRHVENIKDMLGTERIFD